MRTFISINLDESTKNEIYKIQKEIKNYLDENTVNSIKWEEREKFHITLFFLGDVTDSQADLISEKLESVNSGKSISFMKFKSKSINAFPNLKNPRVLIIDLENEDNQIEFLYNEITTSLAEIGFEPEKNFHSHITLGRVRRDRRVRLNDVAEKIIPDFEFEVKEFYFMESKMDRFGSKYKVIKKFELF